MNKNLKYWLAINTIPDLGPVTIKKLVDHFGSIDKVWQAEPQAFSQIEGLNRKALNSFLNNRNNVNPEAELEKIAGINVVTLEDETYPELLKHIYDPPPVLYFKGELARPDEKTLAIVGTRKASRYGLEFAKKLASDLAGYGIMIVSGLAAGIDTAAHQGALEASGKTLAVFGCGVDYIFPSDNRELASKIEKSGALVSEFPLGTKTERSHFPRRNRIISGLSLGVIVVEGHYDSGAMITAKQALDQGREVFAVPGNVELEQSKGPHWLIKQGAKLVESVEDVLEELNIKKMPNAECRMTNEGVPAAQLSDEEKRVVAILSKEPKMIDKIAQETGFSAPQTASILMVLEVKNIVQQYPGQSYIIRRLPE